MTVPHQICDTLTLYWSINHIKPSTCPNLGIVNKTIFHIKDFCTLLCYFKAMNTKKHVTHISNKILLTVQIDFCKKMFWQLPLQFHSFFHVLFFPFKHDNVLELEFFTKLVSKPIHASSLTIFSWFYCSISLFFFDIFLLEPIRRKENFWKSR